MTVTLKLAAGILIAALVAGSIGEAVTHAQGLGTTASPGGAQEGIKVHGRWTIEVRNPDGSLASHHEFNNALFQRGPSTIAGFLGRVHHQIAEWHIYLLANRSGSGGTSLLVREYTGAGPAPLGTLSVVTPIDTNGDATGTVELRGTGQFPSGVALDGVSSWLTVCPDLACATGGRLNGFSEHSLATPIPVAANQIVQVTVVFSFS